MRRVIAFLTLLSGCSDVGVSPEEDQAPRFSVEVSVATERGPTTGIDGCSVTWVARASDPATQVRYWFGSGVMGVERPGEIRGLEAGEFRDSIRFRYQFRGNGEGTGWRVSWRFDVGFWRQTGEKHVNPPPDCRALTGWDSIFAGG